MFTAADRDTLFPTRMAQTYIPPNYSGPHSGLRRISSRWTFFTKKIAPVLMFGYLVVFALSVSTAAKTSRDAGIVLIVVVALGALFYFILRKFVFDLMDDVWDAGDALFIRNQGVEDRVALSQIMNISYSTLQNPPRVTLMLRIPCRFGSEISFMPPSRLLPFTKSPIIDDLIRRVDAARRA